jgi:L-alanine-DL-glutamate epimerase-like enolase superfamily enzyme
VKIVEIREKTIPISSPIRNAYIDFSKMTLSLVAVVTDAIRDGKPVVGYGFNSNGRYGQGKLMRERFIPRVMEAKPESLIDASGENLDPHKIWNTMFTNEKPGGHGERSVAIGTIDMAVWDAVARSRASRCFNCSPTVMATANRTAGSLCTLPAVTTTQARITRSSRTRCAATSTAATRS